jgi:serine/threonine protein kinase
MPVQPRESRAKACKGEVSPAPRLHPAKFFPPSACTVHARNIMTPEHSGMLPTPSPDTSPRQASSGPSDAFSDANDDFGLKPRPKPRRVDPLLGTDLGGITITRLVGEGGMGRVYEAHQEDPPRTVAVKVIRQGITSEKTMRRFEREAEFLGRLQHPGIARIYVVGSYSSDDGDVPFFVMEFVANAKPINHYASENNLSLADRLKLFVSVCEAVSHGHDRGIIHRDLKPGNILIDSNGLPKVIDFGVARSTDSDFSLTSMKTDTGQLVGTVQYMSPEQFGDSPEGLDGRADVYSLGVVLYELIAGVLPYEVRKKKMHEAARIICEEIPPSLRSRDRGIPGDVSLIVERCLEKNRKRRYQGAAALAMDLQRHLAGENIQRSWKDLVRPYIRWAWRQRFWLAALVFLVVLPAIALGWWAYASRAQQNVAAEVRRNLNEGLSGLGAGLANIKASIAEDLRRIAQDGRRFDREECERLVILVWPQWDNQAAEYKRELSRSWVQASQAYPAVSDSLLFQRFQVWEKKFQELRVTLGRDCEMFQEDCRGLIGNADADPSLDVFANFQAELRGRIASWHRDANSRLAILVDEAREDLEAHASELTTRTTSQQDQ